MGYRPHLVLAGRRINDNTACWAVPHLSDLVFINGMGALRCRVGFSMVTFKQNCPDIRSSGVVDMARELELGASNSRHQVVDAGFTVFRL